MSRKRRHLSGAFKAQVALAAARGDKTTAELAAKFGVHGNQVSAWKKQLLEGAPDLFLDRRTRLSNPCSVNCRLRGGVSRFPW
jgi:transposase